MVCCTIVFVLAILAALNDVSFFIIPILSFAFALAAFLYRRERLLLVLICMITAISGFLNTQYQINREIELSNSIAGKCVDAVMVATDFSSGGKAFAKLRNGDKGIKVYLSSNELGEVFPGDVIKANVTLCSADINGEDFARYLYGQNVFVRAYADRIEMAGADFSGITGRVYKIRRYIRDCAQKVFKGDILALYEAMVIGDASLMTPALKEKLRGAGLSHIAVVSGMHLSIMLSVIVFLLRSLIGRSRFGAVASILMAVFITLVCGCGSSVVRACIMCVIFQIARLLYREGDPLSALSVSILVMSAYNPYVIYNAGFILSVLATMGIILFSKRVGSYFEKSMPKHLSDMVTVCVCAQIAVMPYLLYQFQSFSRYTVIANVAVTFFANILVVAGVLFPVLASVPIISILVQMCITGASRIIIVVCETVQKLPRSVINTGRPGAFFISAWIFMLCALKMYPKQKKNLIRTGVALLVAATVSFTLTQMEKSKANIYFVENDIRSSSAIFCEDGSVLIGCTDYYDALSLAEKKADGVYDYLCVNESSSKEAELLIEQGGVRCVIVCHTAGGQGIQRIIECADQNGVVVIKLDFDEEYAVFENTYVSFMSFGEEYAKCGAVKFDCRGNSYVSLEGMSGKDAKRFGKEILCSAVRFPKLADEVVDELKYDCIGRLITHENKFFLKGKE